MITNPDTSYYFAGLGFTVLNLSIGDRNAGSLVNQSLTQNLSDISFDNATGAISFAVAESPELVRDIQFTGNAITDDSGSAIGFAGTWKGERVTIIRSATGAEHANGPRQEEALPGPLTPGLAVQGYWSAVESSGGQ